MTETPHVSQAQPTQNALTDVANPLIGQELPTPLQLISGIFTDQRGSFVILTIRTKDVTLTIGVTKEIAETLGRQIINEASGISSLVVAGHIPEVFKNAMKDGHG